jgi:hypothetical protein
MRHSFIPLHPISCGFHNFLFVAYVRPKLVVAQFRHHIARERDNDHEKEGRQQVLRATFAEIRNSVRELIETEMDELAHDFPDTDDMELKKAIEYLAKEYGKLGEPWVPNIDAPVAHGPPVLV